jgi:hypothetical protein
LGSAATVLIVHASQAVMIVPATIAICAGIVRLTEMRYSPTYLFKIQGVNSDGA